MHTGSTPARKPLTVLALVGAVLALLLGGAAPPSHTPLSADPIPRTEPSSTHRPARSRSRSPSR